MLKWFENYRHTGQLHRAAINDLPNHSSLSIEQKQALSKAARKGKYMTIATQFAGVLGIIAGAEKFV